MVIFILKVSPEWDAAEATKINLPCTSINLLLFISKIRIITISSFEITTQIAIESHQEVSQ